MKGPMIRSMKLTVSSEGAEYVETYTSLRLSTYTASDRELFLKKAIRAIKGKEGTSVFISEERDGW